MTKLNEIQFRSYFTAELVDHQGDDKSVALAARVSTLGRRSVDGDDKGEAHGLINYLMKNRHGTPFEHNSFTFFVHAPIFVFREFQRHRIASYNEESGRYRELDPIFYTPGEGRPLQQTGKAGEYRFQRGTSTQYTAVDNSIYRASRGAYGEYERLLGEGVAREVARMVLPLNIYSTMYVTMNARSLMNFLSLRTAHESAAVASYPMHEIEQVATKMEYLWAKQMPLTHRAFNAAGRVAP